MYNPIAGRWHSADPLGVRGGTEIVYSHAYVANRLRGQLGSAAAGVSDRRFGGINLNLYAYADNDPANRVDPSGKLPTNGMLSGDISQPKPCGCGCSTVVAVKKKCPECKKIWNPPTIPLFKNFKYGCFCGKEEKKPKKGKIPIDATDACCQKHDACCGAAKTAAAKKKCNADLTKCVTIALFPEEIKGSCAKSKIIENIKCCQKAANQIVAWFRAAGSKYC